MPTSFSMTTNMAFVRARQNVNLRLLPIERGLRSWLSVNIFKFFDGVWHELSNVLTAYTPNFKTATLLKAVAVGPRGIRCLELRPKGKEFRSTTGFDYNLVVIVY